MCVFFNITIDHPYFTISNSMGNSIDLKKGWKPMKNATIMHENCQKKEREMNQYTSNVLSILHQVTF